MSTSVLKEFLDDWAYRAFLIFGFLVFVFNLIRLIRKDYTDSGIGRPFKKLRRLHIIRIKKKGEKENEKDGG